MVHQVTQVDIQCRGVFKYLSSSFRRIFSDQEPTFEISSPYNFVHVQHAELDPRSTTGIVMTFVMAPTHMPRRICSKVFKDTPLYCIP